MNVGLKKLYVENYKLFTSKCIEFNNNLMVFDGPNGYGKTSIFDAIELLITGTISRVDNSEVISGKAAYSSNYLSKDKTRDVIIKGEFEYNDKSEKLIIALKIVKGEVKASINNNPRNIYNLVNTYHLNSFDIPAEEWEDYYINQEEADIIRKEFFGEQNLDFFNMFHYIQQEDRLSYFKRSESDRTKAIEGLFGIQNYIEKSEKLDKLKREIRRSYNELTKKEKSLSDEIEKMPENTSHQVVYASLSDKNTKWNQKTFDFRGASSATLYNQLISQVDVIKMIYMHRDEFYLDRDLSSFYEIDEEHRLYAILAWKIINGKTDVEYLRQEKAKLDFIINQKNIIDKMQYERVDWQKLCELINAAEYINQFVDLVAMLKNQSANQNALQRSINSLNNARKQLKKEKKVNSTLAENRCPYCGYLWNNEGELEKQFSETQLLIDEVLGREFVEYKLTQEKIESFYNECCKEHLEKMIDDLNNNIELQVFMQFTDWQMFYSYAHKCAVIMKRLKISPEEIDLDNSLQNSAQSVTKILDLAHHLKETLSPEYCSLNYRHHFQDVYRNNFEDPFYLETLSLEKLNSKEEYISNQYYLSFEKKRIDLENIKKQVSDIKNVEKQLAAYHDILKRAIISYRKRVIEQIEIPFYFYSSRLLQSYQGGQGVLIKSEGNGVRFVTPNSDHDVLYTMSSGQLSAILMSFSLALNKIYAGPFFKLILIDDPIQCMDDINMISFIELLRTEFSSSQIILSTHEDDFSSYICYKFDKYGLDHKSIMLKNSNSIVDA